MAFFCITCGTHTFQSLLTGYENVTCPCRNCGNNSAKVYKRWEWFTVCFVPLIPFSLKPWHEVGCHICNFWQDLSQRPEIQSGGQPAQNWSGGHDPGQGQPQIKPGGQVPVQGGYSGAGGVQGPGNADYYGSAKPGQGV